MPAPLLRMENIVKSFPEVIANRGISLEVQKGEVHALLGENGAGKTVLMNVLFGLFPPDSGSIFLNEQLITLRSPRDALSHRIGMVHQHFMLEPTLTVAENIILGQYPPLAILNKRRLGEVQGRIRELSRQFGLDIDPVVYVSSLSVGEQQWVEILKVLYHGADLLILDEPTAVLTPQETDRLLKFLRDLVKEGMTAVFISHKLDEVMQVSDRVTVLRDGQVIGTRETSRTNPRELARMMVGREVLMDLPRRDANAGEPVLTVRNLQVRDARGLLAVKGVSLQVREGEIVGVAGVSGNGQTELALALAGLADSLEYDQILLGGRDLGKRELANMSRMRTAHIPEDRQKMGVILPFSVAENFIIEEFREPQFSQRGFLRRGRIHTHSVSLVKKFDIRVANVNDEIAHLSGGNQQKVVVARELERHPRFLLVNQPTRGIDVGATEFVRQQILEERRSGTAILLISTDLEEIFALSDRILVMFEGEIVGELPPDRALLEEAGLMMAGNRH
jgi:general nucleoside transport system ATP-binding protein